MIKYKVTLTQEEREQMKEITRKCSHTAKKVIHSLILFNVDEGRYCEDQQTNEEICKVLKIGMRTIDRVRKRFVLRDLILPWTLPQQLGYIERE